MKSDSFIFYPVMRQLLGLALGFYFRRIERFHPERIPAEGPLLITANHPCSLTDAFVIGAASPRQVHFMATVQLFRFGPLKWLLTRCGVIPVNRLKDDPRGMRSVLETFERCFAVMERGGAVALFPEGITHDDPQLKEVKTGAARMALELEQRHAGRLGLHILPVGLSFSGKEHYRSEVLVNFGELISVRDFLPDAVEHRKEGIARLTAEIEMRIQSLILHLPQLEHARVIGAVKRLYLDKLRGDRNMISDPVTPRAEELELSRRIAEVVDEVFRAQPERAAGFAGRMAHYESLLARLRLADDSLEQCGHRRTLCWRSAWFALLLVAGLPVALYGWLHRLIPYLIVRASIQHFAAPHKSKAQVATAAMVSGTVAFGGFYGLCVLMCHRIFGWPVSFWYALTLPVASIAAYYYVRWFHQLKTGARTLLILLRSPSITRRLAAMRAALIAEIETVHAEIKHARTAASTSQT